MRRKYSQARLQPIGDILFSAFKKRGMAAKLEENALFKLWPKAVGAQIAAADATRQLACRNSFCKNNLFRLGAATAFHERMTSGKK